MSCLGVDVHSDFIEKSIVNYQAYRKHFTQPVDFQGTPALLTSIVNDLLDPSTKLRMPGKADIVNFGFEVSLDLL